MINLSAGCNEVLRLGAISLAEQETARIARSARIEAKLVRIDAAKAKHTCGRTVHGVLACKPCLALRAKIDLIRARSEANLRPRRSAKTRYHLLLRF